MFTVWNVLCASAFASAVALAGCEVRFNAGAGGDPTNVATPGEAAGPTEPGDPPGESHINPKTKKDVAEEQLEKLNGKVKRDAKQPGNPVVEVRLFSDKVTDDDLKELASFKKLRRLEFSAEGVTGTGFGVIADLPIEELHVMFA